MENKRLYEPKFYTDEYLKNKSGIYQIRNLVNNKIYIGSSENFYLRYRSHFYELDKNNHRNDKLQRAYNKYGKNNFIFEVIEHTKNKGKLLEREQYWIDKLNVVKNGYNIQPIAGKIKITNEIRDKMRGKTPWNKGKTGIYTKETLQKMKDNASNRIGNKNSFYGKKHSEKTKNLIGLANSKKVLRLKDKKIYKSVQECAKDNNMCRRQISLHCLNRLSTKNREFIYYDDYLRDIDKIK